MMNLLMILVLGLLMNDGFMTAFLVLIWIDEHLAVIAAVAGGAVLGVVVARLVGRLARAAALR